MAKREKTNITLGSGKVYITEYTSDTTLSHSTICATGNLLGYIKGGATLTYSEETYEEKDDLGLVSKIITTSEKATLKLGLLTWNGETLQKLIDRCGVTSASGTRTIKIGGAGNKQGKKWAVCFKHEDAVDGDVYVLICGRNTAGFTLTFASEAGTVIEPEFTAMPQDDNGTLITLIEDIGAAATGGGSGT